MLTGMVGRPQGVGLGGRLLSALARSAQVALLTPPSCPGWGGGGGPAHGLIALGISKLSKPSATDAGISFSVTSFTESHDPLLMASPLTRCEVRTGSPLRLVERGILLSGAAALPTKGGGAAPAAAPRQLLSSRWCRRPAGRNTPGGASRPTLAPRFINSASRRPCRPSRPPRPCHAHRMASHSRAAHALSMVLSGAVTLARPSAAAIVSSRHRRSPANGRAEESRTSRGALIHVAAGPRPGSMRPPPASLVVAVPQHMPPVSTAVQPRSSGRAAG